MRDMLHRLEDRFPRMRGDEPQRAADDGPREEFSPHARG